MRPTNLTLLAAEASLRRLPFSQLAPLLLDSPWTPLTGVSAAECAPQLPLPAAFRGPTNSYGSGFQLGRDRRRRRR